MTCTCFAVDNARTGHHHSIGCPMFVGKTGTKRRTWPRNRAGSLTVRLNVETYDIIAAMAQARGVPMSAIVRDIVDESLKRGVAHETEEN